MAIQFPDSNPTATSNTKTLQTKVVRMLFSDFIVGTASSVKAVLPADATIVNICWWKKTAFSGGGVSAALISVGTLTEQYISNFDVNTPAAGTNGDITPLTNIMQSYGLPIGSDKQIIFSGGAAGGNPTAGELYITIYYVR